MPESLHPMKFLCDEMLRGLARWLRAAGYDTDVARAGEADGSLLARAREEARFLLTRDRKMVERRGGEGVVVTLRCNDTAGCADELARRLPVDWLHAPFSRCLICNTPLVSAPEGARERVPGDIAENHATLYYCAVCDRLYWEGGHVRRMRHKLTQWRRDGPRGGEGSASRNR